MICVKVVRESTYEGGLQACWTHVESLQLTLCWLRSGGSCCGQGGTPPPLVYTQVVRGGQRRRDWDARLCLLWLFLINNSFKKHKLPVLKVELKMWFQCILTEFCNEQRKRKLELLFRYRVFWCLFYIEPLSEPTDFLFFFKLSCPVQSELVFPEQLHGCKQI